MSSKKMNIKRGDIYFADLSPVIGSEQGGVRPVLIVQNNIGNKYSPTTIVAPITSKMGKSRLPTHIDINPSPKNGLEVESVVLLEQVRTVDKKRLKEYLGSVEDEDILKIDEGLKISLQI